MFFARASKNVPDLAVGKGGVTVVTDRRLGQCEDADD